MANLLWRLDSFEFSRLFLVFYNTTSSTSFCSFRVQTEFQRTRIVYVDAGIVGTCIINDRRAYSIEIVFKKNSLFLRAV